MTTFFKGLHPLSTETGCYHYGPTCSNRLPWLAEKKDLPFSDFIRSIPKENLSLVQCFGGTYLSLVGHHDSFNIRPDEYINKTLPTFKGILDFLILPLIARRLWNWSFLMMDKGNNSFGTELAISAARTFGMVISAARVILGIIMTLVLTPAIVIYYFCQDKLRACLDKQNGGIEKVYPDIEEDLDIEEYSAATSQLV